MKTKQYMMQYSDGILSTDRLNVNLRNCPFCDSEPKIDGLEIFCSLCGASPNTGEVCGQSIHELRFQVNTWNGFLRYDENGRPNPEMYKKFMDK